MQLLQHYKIKKPTTFLLQPILYIFIYYSEAIQEKFPFIRIWACLDDLLLTIKYAESL
jgi:hypothetical protein